MPVPCCDLAGDNCKGLEVNMMEQADYPIVTLSLGGPDRWRGSTIRITLRNANHYFCRVPADFATGTEESVELSVYQSYKYNA